jgi:NAD(P)-dependent dehydrogenase (short-subunit alcohol dehydrogenase family)
MQTIQGRVAVVTGAGCSGEELGIGAAIAIRFAREGAMVCLVDRDADSLKRTTEVIQAEDGRCASIQADVSIETDCSRIAREVADTVGIADILVNNVGVSDRTSLPAMTLANWDRVMAVNLTSMMLMCKTLIPHMIRIGGGSIVNVSSLGGVLATGNIAYGASKAGVIMLTRDLATAYGRSGVRVNALAPGHVYSSMVREISPARRDRRRRIAPLGIEGTPWDVASAALFLASEESRFITGALIPVDGGVSQLQALAGLDLVEDVSTPAVG